MKKWFCVIAAACLMWMCSAMSVQAVDVKYLSVFGDSIPDGYGLADQKDNFVNLLAEDYGVEVQNFSVSGTTSSQILSQIKNAPPSILRQSDTIIISAGGNDMLHAYCQKMLETAYRHQEELASANLPLDSSNAIQLLSQLSELSGNAPADTIFAEAVSEEAKAQYDRAVEEFDQNIRSMADYIRSINAQADIYFLTLYNPISVFSTGNDFFHHLDGSIAAMQQSVKSLAEGDDRIHVVDALDYFSEHYADWTRIYQFDIHPNEEGHRQLFLLSKDVISAVPEHAEESSEEESSSIEESSKEKSTVVQESSVTSVSEMEASYHYDPVPYEPDNSYITWIMVGGGILLAVILAVIIIVVKNF